MIKRCEMCKIYYLLVALIVLSSFSAFSQNLQYLSPRPNAILVSPKTNIIIRPGEILDRSSINEHAFLSIYGSLSGAHSGKVDLSDDEKTLLFQPDIDFALGERVQVKLFRGLKTIKGNAVDPFTFSFTITSSYPVEHKKTTAIFPEMKSIEMRESVTNQAMKKQIQFRKKESDFPPDFPLFDLTVLNNPTPGALFLSVQSSKGIPFLVIIGDSGKMIFCRQMEEPCADFKMQSNGLLTYFDHVPEYFYALDSSYAIVDSFKCGNGYLTDMHDLQLLPNHNALLMGLDQQTIDMSQIVEGGLKDAKVTGLIIQEIDKNKRVVFEWRSWDHFKITDAMGIDLRQFNVNYVWGNSVAQDLDGNILLSSRFLSEVTKIDRQTGEIIWRLGGKNNQFIFINDSSGFINQHDARRLPNGNITLFDNGEQIHKPYSRAVEYKLDEIKKTATLVWQYQNNLGLQAVECGNVQRLPNGNTLIGWGTTNIAMTEVRPDGIKELELKFRDDFVYSYRIFKFPWKTNLTSVKESPSQFSLSQNYPNPISQKNTVSTIQYSLLNHEHVQLKLFDLFGREIRSLVDEMNDVGQHNISFDVSHLVSGVYFYRIITPTFTQIRSMIVVK